MAELYAVAGWKIFIGPAIVVGKVDLVAADFLGVDAAGWVEIDGWETMGAFGDTAQTITTSLINRGRDVKQKGTLNAGSMENNFAFLAGAAADPGQAAAVAASRTRSDYQIMIQANDAPSGGTPTTFLFAAMVMSSRIQGGGANSVMLRNVTMEINSNIVEIAAAA